MIEPSFTELMKSVDSRYSLVIAASKRARQLINGEEPTIVCPNAKPVSIALNELARGTIKIKENK